MSLFKPKLQRATARERKKKKSKPPLRSFLDPQRLMAGGVFFGFGLLIAVVCFVGLSPAGPPLMEGQEARIRIVADFPYSYTSAIQRRKKIERARRQVPPVYRLEMAPYEAFRDSMEKLAGKLNEWSRHLAGEIEGLDDPALRMAEAEKFLRPRIKAFESASGYSANPESLAAILAQVEAGRAGEVLRESLLILENILRGGVYDPAQTALKTGANRLNIFEVRHESGRAAPVEAQEAQDALRSLRISLAALDVPREVSAALYQILSQGLEPNMVYDAEKSEMRIQEAIKRIKPEPVEVAKEESIIEPGSYVTAMDLEKLNVYRQELKKHTAANLGVNKLLVSRLFMTFVVLLAAAIYIKISHQQLHRQTRLLALAFLIILFNMLIIRLIYEAAELEIGGSLNPALVAVSPYLSPVALGPVILAVLLGSWHGVLAALLVSVFYALMQGNSLALLLVSLLASLTGIYYCRNVQVRTRLLGAGLLSGLCVAISAFFLGLRDNLSLALILQQMGAGLVVGVLTGMAVVGFLPVLEKLFRRCTDITLLELTDFNHPLLRRLQMEAPGSYHHSLMVANLSERAAVQIGANPLVCRVCSYFHDAGKLVKPEYFAENQREGANPHLHRNPSMSALVIKSHVKEGSALAKQHKLPRLITDVIQQHHGTSLIQYFYYKALAKQRANLAAYYFNDAPVIDFDQVSESTYRYEGPKPRSRESAIIMLADSVEAACRSLKKITPQSVRDLIENIVQTRIEDGQLDDTAITLREISKIKDSFHFILLNMLHSRVEYPSKEKQKQAAAEVKEAHQRPSNGAPRNEKNAHAGKQTETAAK